LGFSIILFGFYSLGTSHWIRTKTKDNFPIQ
jgi:hypothetical protein